MKLSIVIPVYNEENLISFLLEKVSKVNLLGNIEKEVIVVNDCSTDNTAVVLRNYISNNPSQNLVYFEHATNQGKGAALRTGISRATGDYVVYKMRILNTIRLSITSC
jgi:glycosyltransferase involved in cell wall biosynthesis